LEIGEPRERVDYSVDAMVTSFSVGVLAIGMKPHSPMRVRYREGSGMPQTPSKLGRLAEGFAAPQLPQAPNMTFFVTSVGPGKGADIGGLEGADQYCQQLAQRHGAGGKTWRAYLSTQAVDGKPAVNARDRIGNGPWQNFKGEIVAQNLDDLHSDNNKLGMNTSLTERG
jgi:hypothetical protein